MTIRDATEVDVPKPKAVAVEEIAPREPKGRRIRAIRWTALLTIALIGLFLAGYLPRRAARERLVTRAEAQEKTGTSAPATVKPKRLERTRPLKLSATLAPHEQTVVHARAQGYLRRWRADIGDHVDAGQVLAEIDTPELDRELEQARASVVQSEAALTLSRAAHDFSRSSLERSVTLSGRKLTSTEELEQHQAAAHVDAAKVQVAEAELTAQRAALKRLEQLKAFSEVRAPFAGTITSRTAERGALVTPGGSAALFELESLDPLRIIVDVPQSWTQGVKRGATAKLSVPEQPAHRFEAKVARTSGRLDARTRTLRVELEVPNADGKLLPGMYGTVELSLETAHEVYVLPASALVNGRDGSKVAVVGQDRKVRLIPVVVERDNGADVEIALGLEGTETLLANPSLENLEQPAPAGQPRG